MTNHATGLIPAFAESMLVLRNCGELRPTISGNGLLMLTSEEQAACNAYKRRVMNRYVAWKRAEFR
jgi:hypothetical protein